MPQVACVFGTSATRPILLSPRPISVSRCVWLRRIGLPVCTILKLSTLMACRRGRWTTCQSVGCCNAAAAAGISTMRTEETSGLVQARPTAHGRSFGISNCGISQKSTYPQSGSSPFCTCSVRGNRLSVVQCRTKIASPFFALFCSPTMTRGRPSFSALALHFRREFRSRPRASSGSRSRPFPTYGLREDPSRTDQDIRVDRVASIAQVVRSWRRPPCRELPARH
jgi:hypothetical protein